MSSFKEIKPTELRFAPFDIKDKNWMLITAAKPDGSVNTMTASWGGFGVMWNKNVVYIVIRPQRYTKEFVESAESFSLTFFEPSFKQKLAYLGKVSGRDENKIEKAGLSVLFDNEIPYFEQAETVIFAKKLYAQPLGEEFFIDKTIIDTWYPIKDYHTLYVGEITKILQGEHSILKDLDNILL